MKSAMSWLQGIVVALLLCALPVVVNADASLCVRHFKQRQYERAAVCFESRGYGLEKKKLNFQNRTRLFMLFRNAALSLRRDAKQSKGQHRKSYLYERASLHTGRILKRKYFVNGAQKNLILILHRRSLQAIGAAEVSIATGQRDASIQISGGYRFRKLMFKGALWQGRLRPGAYTITIFRPKGTPQMKVLQVKPGMKPVIITFSATPVVARQAPSRRVMPRRRDVALRRIPPAMPASSSKAPSIAPWVLIGVGAALTVAGGVLVGVGAANNASLHQQSELLMARTKRGETVQPDETLGIKEGFAMNSTIYAAGWVTGGVGLATVITGIVIQVATRN